tara:strand:- start:131 stop:346 length:216 start_codon:yes stop_codon:yes gene_type:complete
MNTIIWVLAYTTSNENVLEGFLKDPEFLFQSQELAQLKKQEAFDILHTRNLVSTISQIRAVPLNELDTEIL